MVNSGHAYGKCMAYTMVHPTPDHYAEVGLSHVLLTTYYTLHTTYYLLLTTYYSLLTTYYLLQMGLSHVLLTTDYR